MRLPPGNMTEMIAFLRAEGVPLAEALDTARARFPDEALVCQYEMELQIGVVGDGLRVPKVHLVRLVAMARRGLTT